MGGGENNEQPILVPFNHSQDFDDINEKLRQIEQEAEKIRAMQNEVEKQFHGSTSSTGSPGLGQPPMSIEEKMSIDSRSIYVGNVKNFIYHAFNVS